MSEYNIVVAHFGHHNRVVMTDTLYQYDYGQKLKVEGITALPQTFQAHFSNVQRGGVSITVTGINGMVDVPNSLLMTGKRIYCWIYVTETGSGETVYQILMPVQSRPMPEYYDVEDVGVFDSVVQQVAGYAATATTGATSASASATAAAGSETAAAASASAAADSAENAAASETNAEASASAAQASDASAAYAATMATTKAAQAAQSATSAGSAADRAEAAQTAAVAAQNAAETAATSATADAATATAKATAAAASAATASTKATDATNAATTATAQAVAAESAKTTAVEAKTAAQAAQSAAETAATNATAKATEAAASATAAAQSAASINTPDAALSDTSTNAVQNKVITGELADVKSAIGQLDNQVKPLVDLLGKVDMLERVVFDKRYGVSGIGQSASALTRLWDSVGMTAQVGTDGDNSSVVNDFDKAAPFMRRKCVGEWSLVNGKAVFTVNAYYGDADYTEDGTKGDYVAVECPLSYYYMDNGTLGISCYKHPGYRPFDIFCRDHNEDDVMPYYYLPAYALGVKDSKAVSLPGLDNVQGTYKGVLDAARTYKSGALGGLAVIQPMAVNFYEWALFTVEFAVQNGQSVMMGCCNLRHNADDRATLRSDGKWLLSNYQAARVAGEYVSIQGTSDDINAASLYASHKITSIIRCDANGDEDASGSYQLIETDDLGTGRTYEVGASYRIAARPYRTGSCNTVSTPSGSPVSNADGYHPMKYRWRENPYGNQYKTVVDLFNKRVGTGDSDWILEHYYLPKPQDYEPSSASKPDATDLATNAFAKLDIETAHANYANGYIKSKKYAALYPDIWIPFETDGGSTTYFADYANLVLSYAVRAVRLGGSWSLGAHDGFSYFLGHNAPSSGYAYYGGDLCIIQDTGGELSA